MKLKINKIIKYLILSDLVFYAGWGLFTPVFAIFIVEKIQGGNALTIGIATAIYWILMSILRIPFGMFLDNQTGESDDYWFTFWGFLIAATVPFGFLHASLPWHLYALQAIYALGMAMNLAGWSAIFTRNIDAGKESTEWGLSATGYSLGTGIAGLIGGYLVNEFDFAPVLIGVGILGILGAILLLIIRKDIIGKPVGKSTYFGLKELLNK
ncbi:MAG: MFS transporter [Patescibacteria group bacterium]